MLIMLAGTSGHKHTDGRACRHMLLGVCVKELVMRVFRTSLYPQLIASTFSYGSSYWEEREEEGGVGWVQSIANTASFREFQLFVPRSSEFMKHEHALANTAKTTNQISG